MINMAAAQWFISPQSYLADPLETHLGTKLSGASCHGGTPCWTETIQYPFRMYETASAMREMLEDLCKFKQKADKTEDEYRKRLNGAIVRCGNFHSEDEKIILYLDGLSTTINIKVSHHLENIHLSELTFESFRHLAETQDEAYCTRLHNPWADRTINETFRSHR